VVLPQRLAVGDGEQGDVRLLAARVPGEQHGSS
jgi:hypothetical protein